jgi:integrase
VPYLSPPTLTRAEQRAILAATKANPRDHLIYSLALGTGLRLGELVGLNVGDVFLLDWRPKARILVRPEIAKRGRAGDVFLPDALIPKLKRFWRFKKARGEDLEPAAPLLCSQAGRRLSPRRIQFAWREWQRRAGLGRPYPFHCLRHTSVTAVYRATHDLFVAQRFARHARTARVTDDDNHVHPPNR